MRSGFVFLSMIEFIVEFKTYRGYDRYSLLDMVIYIMKGDLRIAFRVVMIAVYHFESRACMRRASESWA